MDAFALPRTHLSTKDKSQNMNRQIWLFCKTTGFLRSARALTQIAGRAARNANGKVIRYCDKISDARAETIKETKRRRSIQEAYNKEHNRVPKTIRKPIEEPIHIVGKKHEKGFEGGKLTAKQTERMIRRLTTERNKAAKALDFDQAALLRDQFFELKATRAK